MSARNVFGIFYKRQNTFLKILKLRNINVRTILSSAYACEDAWNKRFENSILKDIKMAQYFIEVDKKFQTKNKASGVDIDLFANNVKQEVELDELEHLLYRFRRTKRSMEMMESTHYATIKSFLKFEKYEQLLHILHDKENYGVFPDFFCYNILMDIFLEKKAYRDAAHIAVLMMLQEEFSNPISRILGLYSCQMFLNNCSIDTWFDEDSGEEAEVANNEDDDDEEMLVRVPFLRNPWFDDHFDIKNPKHLIGKTFYLIGREEMNSSGASYQLLGLGMYEKWEKAYDFLTKVIATSDHPTLLDSSISKFKELLEEITDEEIKQKWVSDFEKIFEQLQNNKRIEVGDYNAALEQKLKEIPSMEEVDIAAQTKLFQEWEQNRKVALSKQIKELDRERRLKVIAEKKEYLYWKEKELFFFENQAKIMEELEEVEKIIAQTSEKSKEETYEPPEIVKKPLTKLSRLRKKARVKAV